MSSAVAAKPEEKKSKAAARSAESCEGQQWDESQGGASAGMPMFLGGGCGCKDCAARVQAKLAIGQVGDPYERQADRVADRALSGGGPRRSAKPSATVGHASSPSRIPTADAGSPLHPGVRERIEPSLGADLSHVRVHEGPSDRKMARDLKAQAFTHGKDIWLGPSQSSSDVKLMAHEATHVVQQGAAAGKTPTVQRREDDSGDPGEQAGSGKGSTGPIQQMLKQLPAAGSQPDTDAKGAAAPAGTPKERPDPAKMAQKKAELRGIGQPAVDSANRGQPRLRKAAQAAKVESRKPANPAKLSGGKPAAKVPPKKSATTKRSASAGGAMSIGLQKPSTPPQVQLPKIAAPVDAAGKPLAPDPGGDAFIVKLVMMAQAMRLKGFMLRDRAAQERHNAAVLQAKLNKVHEGIAEADHGITQSQDHLAYRRELTGQTEGVLKISEQKAETVAAGAPKYQSESAEGKAKSAPMAGEAKDLAGQNAANSADEDGAEESQEQGQKLGQVGSDIGSMDDAMTQTKAKADNLAGDAARAKQTNTKTQQNITGTHAALDQTGGKLTQMTGQSATAKAQAAANAHGPAHMLAGAAALDQQGLAAIQSSVEMEARVHSVQQRYLDGMRSVPQSKRGKASSNGGPPATIQRQAEPGADDRVNLNWGAKVGEALPSWLTGEEKQTEKERADAQAAEKKRREDEIKEINDKAGGDFSKLTAADKAGIALSLTGRHLFGSVAGIKWPNLVGKLLQGLVDPRMALMGVVSGLSMALSGVGNLFSIEQWKKDPLGNLLKSAADIATGITIVLGSITALAMAIIAIMIAAAILTLGALGPVAAAVIPFCTTVVGTVGPWTIEAAAIALELNILLMIKDLVGAATAETATKLQGESDKVTDDAKTAANMAMQIGMAAVGEAGGEALASTEFGQSMAAGMRGIGEDFNIVKPSGGIAPPVPEGAPAEPAAAPASGESAPTPKADAPVPADPASAPKADAPAPADPATAPKADAPAPADPAPAHAPKPAGDPAPAAKVDAPAPADPAAAPKTEAHAPEATPEAPPESKPAEPVEGAGKPEDVVAEQPAANGHKAKVTKEGECLICTDCANANTVIEGQLEGTDVPPAEKAKIEGELKQMNEIAGPTAKAKAAGEIHEEATEAVADAEAKGQPKPPSEELNSNGLTDAQEAEFREKIDNPPAGKTADDMRFERYKQRCANEGREPLERGDWDAAKAQLEANRERGAAQENQGREGLKKTLDRPDLKNNNSGEVVQSTSKDPATGNDVTTRPDTIGLNDKGEIDAVHDHKDLSGSDKVAYDTEQMRAQKRMLPPNSEGHYVTLSSDSPNLGSTPPEPRPSVPLAAGGSKIYYSSGGQVTHQWVIDASKLGGGYWETL